MENRGGNEQENMNHYHGNGIWLTVNGRRLTVHRLLLTV